MADATQHGDIARMQRDAENRIREMQRKADRAIKGNDTPPVPNFNNYHQRNSATQPLSPPQAQTQAQTHPHPHSSNTNHNFAPQKSGILSRFKGVDFLKLFNFKNIHIDSDITVIIALLLLLSTDETDELLILALLYIML